VAQQLRHWLPALFCAALSVLALGVWSGSGDRWTPAFVAFLPMCFLFSGLASSQTSRQVAELQREVAALRSRRPE
jgi:hypothetical protein